MATAALAVLVSLPGCRRPYAASSNLRLTPQEQQQKLTLDAEEQAAVLAAMQSVTVGQRPVDPPARAPAGKRWSDVPLAVEYACDEAEMAVLEMIEEDDGRRLRFRLRTVEDWPGELVVRRAEPEAIYTAEAWVGRFPDQPARLERRDRLLAALEHYMEAFGAKRALPGRNE
jgi:hypothetical protein